MEKTFIVRVPNYGVFRKKARSYYQAKVAVLHDLGLENEVSARSFVNAVRAGTRTKRSWDDYIKGLR